MKGYRATDGPVQKGQHLRNFEDPHQEKEGLRRTMMDYEEISAGHARACLTEMVLRSLRVAVKILA